MQIEPTYVTFEQAKWLKEKGFDEITNTWHQQGDGILDDVIGKLDYYNRKGDVYISLPEQWMVVEWLRVNYNIWIAVSNCNVPEISKWCFDIHKLPSGVAYLWNKNEPVFETPQKAYSAAINYVLNSMI